jgi:hypothetical protein
MPRSVPPGAPCLTLLVESRVAIISLLGGQRAGERTHQTAWWLLGPYGFTVTLTYTSSAICLHLRASFLLRQGFQPPVVGREAQRVRCGGCSKCEGGGPVPLCSTTCVHRQAEVSAERPEEWGGLEI